MIAPPPAGAFRVAYLHVNVPGVLADINRMVTEAGANVVSQSLSTRGEQATWSPTPTCR